MAGGRPTKYKPEFCDKVIEMGKEGMSQAEMAMELDIHWTTFEDWRENKPEFSEAVKVAVKNSQAWWERLGRLGSAGMHDINPTTYIFNMKNRFKDDWRDKHETDITSNGKDIVGITRTIIDKNEDS